MAEHDANLFARVACPHGLSRWIPAIPVLRTYQRTWLPKDLMAGLALTAILVQVGMGYAEAAGLPAIYGLYATIVPLIAYAIFGPSRILVLGPDSSLAAIIAVTIVPLATGDADRLVALAGALALLTGGLCVWRLESLECIGIQIAKPQGFAKEIWLQNCHFYRCDALAMCVAPDIQHSPTCTRSEIVQCGRAQDSHRISFYQPA